MQANRIQTGGMRTFFLVWFGQLISRVGSELTWFALGVWIYEQTGSVTLFSVGLLSYVLPRVLISPIIGPLIDRWDRRWIMILSDAGAGVTTLILWLLAASGGLQVWHIYVMSVFNSIFNTIQWPAYSASTTMLVPKKQLGRAGGMVQIGRAVAELIAPAVAGAIYLTSGLKLVVLIDFATFAFAVTTLMLVRFPKPEITPAGEEARGTYLQESLYGWKYIANRVGLFSLLVYFAILNFLVAMFNPLLIPMMLEIGDADQVGIVLSVFGGGLLAGTLVMSAWGGPKRRVLGIIVPAGISGIALVLVGIKPSLLLIAIFGAIYLFLLPIVNASNQALWQTKVQPDVQGRVFASRSMLIQSTMPLGILIAGPLADRVFEPLLAEGGLLAASIGQFFGVGNGRGTGLLFALLGILVSLFSLGAYLYPKIRNLEDDIPDAIADGGIMAPTLGEISEVTEFDMHE